MPSLIIVESPTKAKTLARFLDNSYRIEATMGHVRDLPEKKLGIEIKEKNQEKYEFLPDYQIIAGRKQRVSDLRKLADSSSQIILATDPDREGEAIAYHIKEVISSKAKSKSQNPKFLRIVFHEITKSAIDEALKNPHGIDIKLVDAQQARRILDRLVGYKLSPLLWNKLGKRWLSAGRVQSVAVRLIVEREREIEKFVPLEYWLIEVELTKNQRSEIKDQNDRLNSENNETEKQSFIARLTQIDSKKAEVNNKETAERIVADLKISSYAVTDVEAKEVRRFPAAPFTTSTLQQAVSNKYGWSAKRTMRTAQSLYEEGYITYHRTDSTNLALEAIEMARGFILTAYGKSYLPETAKLYKTKSKVAQEAHEAIRPTNIKMLGAQDRKNLPPGTGISKVELKEFPQDLGRDAELLYTLIWKRFLACQINEAVFAATSVTIKAENDILSSTTVTKNRYLLRATGQTMKFAGWLIVYGDKSEEDKREEEDRELPELTAGETVKYLQVIPSQKFTQPPPRYNEASLIKILEEKGIGRPSTYAPIISTIQDRRYVEKIERKFHPTDLGFAVTDFLVSNFPDVFDVTFTAKMEDDLDNVANGEREWQQVLSEFYRPLNKKLAEVFKTAERVKVDLGTTDEKCPQCGSPLAVRMSKYGKFLACSTYPNCKFTKNIVEKAGLKCPSCGSEIVVKRTRKGKQFYGCSNYPKCTFAAWKKEDIK